MKLEFTYIEGIELGISKDDVSLICHSGSNDDEVAKVANKKYIKEQLKRYSDEKLIEAIGYVITDDLTDIDTRQKKEEYIVWIAAWNIFDEQ